MNKKLLGDAGEYFVAFQLANRGINPAIMNPNSEGVDILATDNGENVISIQVKSSRGRNNPRQWDVGRHVPATSKTHFFFFVNLFDDKEEYLIVPSDFVEKSVDFKKERPQFNVSQKVYDKFKFNWDPIFKIFKKTISFYSLT